MKKIIYFIPFIFIILVIFYFENKQFNQRENFYISNVQSKIASIKNNWTAGRSKDYILENGLVITLLSKEKLYINDSIYKESNNWNFKVFRKQKNEYFFIKEYKYK